MLVTEKNGRQKVLWFTFQASTLCRDVIYAWQEHLFVANEWPRGTLGITEGLFLRPMGGSKCVLIPSQAAQCVVIGFETPKRLSAGEDNPVLVAGQIYDTVLPCFV